MANINEFTFRSLNIFRDYSPYIITFNLRVNIQSSILQSPTQWFPLTSTIDRSLWHYHPSSNRLVTATTDHYNFSFFPRAVFHWNNLSLETMACPTLEQFMQPGSLQHWLRLTIGNHHNLTFKPNLYSYLFYFIFC